jgi:hypothetical protein
MKISTRKAAQGMMVVNTVLKPHAFLNVLLIMENWKRNFGSPCG